MANLKIMYLVSEDSDK